MAQDEVDVTVWLQRLKEGSPEAASQVWQHFFERLVQFADRRLGSVPRRDADEEDVALSAMHELHRGVAAGRFPELDNREDLWRILLTITGCKVKKRIRHLVAHKRGGGQVRGESVFGPPADGHGGLNEIAGIPAADFVEQLSIESQEMLDQLNDDMLKRIAMLKLQGFTNEEIASDLKCAVRSVERKLGRIRAIWNQSI